MNEETNHNENFDSKEVFQKACLIQLSTSIWTGSKMLSQDVMENVGNSEWLKGRKYIVNPELLGPVRTAAHQARNEVYKHALPFPITSLSLIPKESLETVDQVLQGYESRFWERVEDFVTHYEPAREEAQRVLGDDLFDETDYPTDIKRKFRFEWRFLSLSLPTKSKILTPEIYKREKDRFEQLMIETRELASEALCKEMADIVENLVEKLNDNGKAKSINSTMFNKIKEFIEVFETKNIFDDDRLAAVVAEADAVLAGVSSYGLRYNKVMKERISGALGEIKDSVDNILTDLPRRKLRLAA